VAQEIGGPGPLDSRRRGSADELTPQVDMIMELLDAFASRRRAHRDSRPTTCWDAGSPGKKRSGRRRQRRPRPATGGGRPSRPVRVLYLGRGWPKPPCSVQPRSPNIIGTADRAGAPTPNSRCCARPLRRPAGVPGVGEKTAATLLAEYGSLDQILAAAHDRNPRWPRDYGRNC